MSNTKLLILEALRHLPLEPKDVVPRLVETEAKRKEKPPAPTSG